MIWFTADLHLWHGNIIKYCDRPFDSAREMNQTILENYQESPISDDDTVYFLGDLMMGGPTKKLNLERYIDRMVGDKHLIMGNHDRLKPKDYIDIGFSSVHYPYFELEDGVVLAHDPATAVTGGLWITAHVHGAWETLPSRYGGTLVNVGVDVRDFSPISYDEVKEIGNHV